MIDKLNRRIFWLTMITCWKNIILFGIQFAANAEKQFDSKHVCDKDFLKTKIKFHGDEATDFYDFKFQTWTHTCLAVISLDAVLKKDDNYNPQVFFKNVNRLRKCN